LPTARITFPEEPPERLSPDAIKTDPELAPFATPLVKATEPLSTEIAEEVDKVAFIPPTKVSNPFVPEDAETLPETSPDPAINDTDPPEYPTESLEPATNNRSPAEPLWASPVFTDNEPLLELSPE